MRLPRVSSSLFRRFAPYESLRRAIRLRRLLSRSVIIINLRRKLLSEYPKERILQPRYLPRPFACPQTRDTRTLIISASVDRVRQSAAGGNPPQAVAFAISNNNQPAQEIVERISRRTDITAEVFASAFCLARQREPCLNPRFRYFTFKGISGFICQTKIYTPKLSDKYLKQKRNYFRIFTKKDGAIAVLFCYNFIDLKKSFILIYILESSNDTPHFIK